MCQSTFHCRLVLGLSLLYLSHHMWGLNHVCLLTEHTAYFKLGKGRLLINPMDVMLCHTQEYSMDKQDVVADVLAKLFLCECTKTY